MKLIVLLPVLVPLFAAPARAADLAPGEIIPLFQKPLAPMDLRLGLDFQEADTVAKDKRIMRRFQLAIGLPAQTELGLAVQDTQEAAIAAKSRTLGGETWLRWTMLRSSLVQAAATLQYQPGLATRDSAFQASQDRTSLGFDLKLRPLSFFTTAVYASSSRRQNERFQNLALGQENLLGARLELGGQSLGVFADGLQRKLSARNLDTGASRQLFAREWKAGVYLDLDPVQLSAFAQIPDSQRYAGTPERGFGLAISVRIGQSAKSDPRDNPEDALIATERADREAAAAKKGEAGAAIKVLESDELDEFQSLDRKHKDEERNQKETAAEKAEREMRESLEREKRQQAQRMSEQEKARREAERARHQQILEDNEKYREYKDDVEKELNEYTLPDQEDMKWNGLTP